jgi:hypothetical protein
MESFIARQPIFDTRRKVYGYELFFRSGLENVFRHSDPSQATSKVMALGGIWINRSFPRGKKQPPFPSIWKPSSGGRRFIRKPKGALEEGILCGDSMDSQYFSQRAYRDRRARKESGLRIQAPDS